MAWPETLHEIHSGSLDLSKNGWELPTSITRNGYLRITQDCSIKIYVKIKNYCISELYLDSQPNTIACRIYLPKDFIFDSASIPWFGRWAVPEIGRHSLPAAFHDLLYRSAGYLTLKNISLEYDCWSLIKLDKRFADKLFFLLNDHMQVRSWRKPLFKSVTFGGHLTYRSYLGASRKSTIATGSLVSPKGYAVCNLANTSVVQETLGNLALFSNGEYHLIHSLRDSKL